MSIKIGDPLFTSDAHPGVMRKSNPVTDKITIDTDSKAVKEHFRHGYLKGLSTDERKEFNEVMDGIKSMEDANSGIDKLHGQITALEKEPTPEHLKLVRYLKAELFHMMNDEKRSPRYVDMPGFKNA